MFINSTNNQTESELRNDFRPYDEQIRRMLGLLDGKERFSYSLWFVPDDAGWPDAPGYNEDEHGREYLQSAGTADGMTVELRRLEEDGQYHQYVVGKPGSEGQSLDREVKYDEYTLNVRPGEVFTADEATPIFYTYFQENTVPGGLVLRELDLT